MSPDIAEYLIAPEDLPDPAVSARDLRAAGWTYVRIGEELRISVRAAWEACQQGDPRRNFGRGHPRGENHWAARLTRADIIDIRRLAEEGVPQTELAREYGVDRSHISKIVAGERWRWLTN